MHTFQSSHGQDSGSGMRHSGTLRDGTDCEWVETGVKDIRDATMNGRTPTKREHRELSRGSDPSQQAGLG